MSHETHYQNGMDHFSEDRMDQAIEELTKAVEIKPDYADAVHALAMCYYHKKDWEHALEHGKRLSELEPSNPLAYTTLSMIYQAKGMIEEAEEMGARARDREASRSSEEPSPSGEPD